MGRGLSQLQRDILRLLPTVERRIVDSHDTDRPLSPSPVYWYDCPTSGDLRCLLGRPDTNAALVSVSKACARLMERGLVVGWQAGVRMYNVRYHYARIIEAGEKSDIGALERLRIGLGYPERVGRFDRGLDRLREDMRSGVVSG